MREITYAQAIRDALAEEMRRDPNVFLIGEDIGVYGGAFGVTFGLIDEFGSERVRDTPLSEAGIVGAAVGAALVGMRPVAEIMFMDFITIGLDQLVNQAAKIRFMFGGKVMVPMVLRCPEGSGTGAAAQHSQSLEAWLAHVPGLKVVIPSTPYDAKGLLKSAIRDDNPVVFIEHKLLYRTKQTVPEDDYVISLGKAEIKRPGKHVTVVATSISVSKAIAAAERLSAEDGLEAEVIDPRTIKPLDLESIVASVRRTGRLVTVHEATKMMGFGAEIVAAVCESDGFHYLKNSPVRLGGADVPIPYNPHLERQVVPQEDNILAALRAVCH